jgi:hypothetical protein
MARMGLWKLRSGDFGGWKDGDNLFDRHGCHAGYFKGDIAYTPGGDYAGEIYRDDWFGKKEGAVHAAPGFTCSLDSISLAPLPDRDGLEVEGWTDPDL